MAKEIPNIMDLFNKVKKMGKNIVNRMDFVYCFIRAKSNFVAFNILLIIFTPFVCKDYYFIN